MRKSVAVVVIILLLASVGSLFAPSEVEPPASGWVLSNQPYTFYLFDAFIASRLIPLDPQTLADQPDGKSLEPGIFSADGSTRVDVEHPEGRARANPEDIWIVVYDMESLAEQGRFHPPAGGFVFDLSADGARLLFRPDPNLPSRYPPVAEWYVIDTANGKSLAHVKDADNSCFRQMAHFDPAGRRIYCVVDPALAKTDEPEPMRIVVYDFESGIKAKEVDIPEVLIGGSGTERSGQTEQTFLEPAVALSPDGRRLAIVHASADKITLLDAQNLTVERSFSLERSLGLLDLLAPAVAYAKGEMNGTIPQAEFSVDGHTLYVFTQEVRPASQQAPPEQRGLWLVDLHQDAIVVEALSEYLVQWVRPAPDGTVFVFGTTDQELGPYEIRPSSPSMLWRLDGRTLEILAAREFTGYRGARLVPAQSSR